MDQHLVLRLPAPEGYPQCPQNPIRCLTAVHGPADDAAGIEIDHDGQTGKAFQLPDIGDVRHPVPVRRSHIELPVQDVGDNHGRLAARAHRPALVADPGLDTGQSGNPVRADRPDPVGQVVMQFAIAIHLAALLPGPADQFGRAGVFLRPRADYTQKHHAKTGRYGWLRLNPAYSLKIVKQILHTCDGVSNISCLAKPGKDRCLLAGSD